MKISDVVSIVDRKLDKGNDTLSGWMKLIVNILGAKQGNDYNLMAKHCNKLSTFAPKNVWLMTKMAQSAAQAEHYEESINLFRQVRALDPLSMEGMETYGLQLLDMGCADELNCLTNDVLAVDSKRYIGWLLAAMFCELKGEHDKSKILVEKAVDIDPLPSCFWVKGRFLLSHGQNEQALIAFFQANSLEKSLQSYSGLVQAHLALGNIKDATIAARDAVTTMPTSSIAYTLIGQCLSRSSTSTEVIKAFTKALKIDPTNTKAASYMAEFYKKQGKLHEASLCLKSILEFPIFGSNQTYAIRTQLAKNLGMS